MTDAEYVTVLAAEVLKLKAELDCAKAFHDVAVSQRDAAWEEVRQLREAVQEFLVYK